MTTEELRCRKCSAPYKGKVQIWISYVKCKYCGAAIPVPKKEETRLPQQGVVCNPPEFQKVFTLDEFGDFLKRKTGYPFDNISGVLIIGSIELCIDEEGNVKGPEPHKSTVERWIFEFMKT